MIFQFLMAIALQVSYATPYWLHLIELVSHQEKKGSNQGWRADAIKNTVARSYLSHPQKVPREASAQERDVDVLPRVRQYFMSSAEVSFYVKASSFSHRVTSETLNKQKHLKGKPINTFIYLYIGYSFWVNKWSKTDTACILPVTDAE